MWNDIRFAFRTLRRSPVFAAVAIFTLALGIAANAAIFSLFYQVLLKSLPVRAPQELVLLHSGPPGFSGWTSADNSETVFSYPMYTALRNGASRFSGLAARSGANAEIAWQGGSDRVQAEVVSGNFFEVLGLQARLGRLLAPSDDQARDGNPVVVLSYPYWVEHFGASVAALNAKLLVNGRPFVIVGVAPEKFNGFMNAQNPAIYAPISMKDEISPGWSGLDKVSVHWLNIVGRMKPGVSAGQAAVSLAALWKATLRLHVEQMTHSSKARQRMLTKTLELHSASQGINQMEAGWREPLTVLLAMAGLLLLIACANVANLLVARAVMRSREMAIRAAIGANRWRMVRQNLAESLVLALAGGVIGTALSFALVRGLIALLPGSMAEHWLSAKPDPQVLGYSLLVVLLTAILFGVLPSLQAARVDPMPALKDQTAAASASGGHARWRQALVTAQLAVSLTLLVGAGLFAKTLLNLLAHDPGFRPEHLLAFSLDPSLNGYSVERGRTLYRELEQRLRQLPGVESAAMGEDIPLNGQESASNVTVEGFTPSNDDDADSDRNVVGPGYFRTIGTPLIAGREFGPQDQQGAAKAVIVNQAFVKHFLKGQRAVGKHMKVGAGTDPLNLEIAGVVKDADNLGFRETIKPMFYLPFEQVYSEDKEIRKAGFFLRARGDIGALERSVRATVPEFDANVPVLDVKTMDQRVNEIIYSDRLMAMLATMFGVLAMVLAAVGLYGVIAYSVARRTAEIGIRLALGALPAQVLGLVMREVLLLAGLGVLAGAPVAYALGRFMSSQLYGVKPDSVGIFCAAAAVLGVAATAAGLVPAYRASGLDPKEALRYE